MAAAVVAGALLLHPARTPPGAWAAGPRIVTFSVVEAAIPDMRNALQQGRVTSRELVTQYLTRIATYEDLLNAVITVNPHALAEAEARDRDRAQGRIRGPLHGIPIALKDIIHTKDLRTTGGALAFVDLVPPYDATVTTNLRNAGAIIIAKTTLTELANWVAGPPTPMPPNYNALTGFGLNPYDPRRDPRPDPGDGRPALSTGGSSSGVGTAASFWAANVGTETSGSILTPANQTMLAAIKPTVGRISRYGIIPITADQDTAGPMARTVTDAAILLGVLEGGTPDPHDAATTRCARPPGKDYTRYLRADGLKGARIGIPRVYFYDKNTPPGEKEARGGLTDAQQGAMRDAIAALTGAGAVVVDPADIPSVTASEPDDSFLRWNVCVSPKGQDGGCSTVFKYGMKRDFNAWLASLGDAAPVKSLTALRAWNTDHAKAGTLKYGQSLLDASDEMDLEADRARYEADRAKDLRLSAGQGIDEALQAHQLDALLFPGSLGAALAARPGYPTVMVPFAMVPNEPTPPFPDGFAARPSPFGVSFTGTACSEPRLLEIAFAFEQATRKRMAPWSTP
ncbi:MAG TPA: amidase family protein [Vicinamibacterales bacterium]|nr:amidase family protein [Vicinamibacterales bacterium]